MIGSGVMPFGKKKKLTREEITAVAKLLAERGPLFAEVVVRELGWTADRWWDLTSACKDWFGLTPKGWILTKEGRAVIFETT